MGYRTKLLVLEVIEQSGIVRTALLSQEGSVIATRSREGWFQRANLQVAASEPPRRFAPPLLTQEGSCPLFKFIRIR